MTSQRPSDVGGSSPQTARARVVYARLLGPTNPGAECPICGQHTMAVSSSKPQNTGKFSRTMPRSICGFHSYFGMHVPAGKPGPRGKPVLPGHTHYLVTELASLTVQSPSAATVAQCPRRSADEHEVTQMRTPPLIALYCCPKVAQAWYE